MSVQSRIAQLEGLLERVQRNAGKPRAKAIVPMAAPVDVLSAPSVTRPVSAAPSVPSVSKAVTQVELPEPTVPVWSTPAPVLDREPEPSLTRPAASAPVLDEVDELLGAEPELSPELPVAVDIETPVSEEVLIIEEPPGAEPELVATAAKTPAPELTFDESFEEVETPSSVRPEFGGLDLVEEAPASSRRPRVASTMDEALAGAAARMEAPLTPPPESGPEPSAGPTELHIPQAPARPVSVLPTTEQLGQTVSLEEGPAADFELDEPLSETEEDLLAGSPEAAHLEAELPAANVGTFEQGLASPPGAREELERVRLGEVQAQVVARPVISTNVVEFVNAGGERGAESFLALIDGSLSL